MGAHIFDIYEDPLSGFELQIRRKSGGKERQLESHGLPRNIRKTLPALVSGVFLSACLISMLSW